ncbi:MAG: hypothetical protein FWD02_01285 [Bacteroidales bacterium]|nr:hypothetical protein [Bacteroidales bacterium]
MKAKFTILYLLVVSSVFAQPLQLRPEVVELYRLQDIALRSRVLMEKDLIEKHEAFFNHPLFCEIAFGMDIFHFAEALLIRGEHAKAEEYLLRSARSHYLSTSTMLDITLNRTMQVWPDTVFLVPRTPESMRFRETIVENILEIENKRNIDPRIIAIAEEIRELIRKDQAVRRLPREDWDSVGRVDSVIIHRVKELIKENPDIDILRIAMIRGVSTHFGNSLDIGLIFWHQRGSTAWWTDFFEAYFRKRAEEGRGLDFCFWYDTVRFIARGEDSFFGMAPQRTPAFQFRLNVDNLDEVNENRAKVGLLPLYGRDQRTPTP